MTNSRYLMFMRPCTRVTSAHWTCPFLEVILGLELGSSSAPSLCGELICSAHALIIYGEPERKGVEAFCLQGSSSVSSSFSASVISHTNSYCTLSTSSSSFCSLFQSHSHFVICRPVGTAPLFWKYASALLCVSRERIFIYV